jgi:cytochrome P450
MSRTIQSSHDIREVELSKVHDEAAVYPFPHPSALEPPAEWARLRQDCPVARVRMASGDEAVLLTRYGDVRQVLSDHRFSRQLTAQDAARVSADEGVTFDETPTPATGPGHLRWRRLVGRTFSARRMEAMRPRIAAMAEHLIDEMLAAGQPADLVSGFGLPLPVWVICDLLGLPNTDRDRFSYWSSIMLNVTRYSRTEIETGLAEFDEYLLGHIADKRAAPGDDLLSELITVVDAEDGRLSEEELLSTGQILLAAGHETTANMIGKMTAMLLADRERWDRLRADESLVSSAVEESLRYDANFGFGIPRYLSEPIEVAGTSLPRGTTVVCNVSAANRDEQAFDRTETMNLARTPNPHLTFGIGQHSCIGQALARVELRVALEALLRRLPTLDLAVSPAELARREGLIVGGLAELPVRW